MVEILIVLGLVGLLVALIAPQMSKSLKSAHLKAATQKTAVFLRYARNQAVAAKRPYWVVFDREESWVAVINRPLNVAEGENRYEKTAAVSSSGVYLYEYPEDVELAEVIIGEEENIDIQGAVIFFPNGSCSGGTILLQLDEMHALGIALDFATGMVTIEKGTDTTD